MHRTEPTQLELLFQVCLNKQTIPSTWGSGVTDQEELDYINPGVHCVRPRTYEAGSHYVALVTTAAVTAACVAAEAAAADSFETPAILMKL